MKLSEQTLNDMHEDLLSFVLEGIKEKNIRIKNTIVRHTKKETDKRKWKKYNTCIESERPFQEKIQMYVNLDSSYDYRDVKELSKHYVNFADYKIKQDAFQLGTISLALKEKYKKMLPGNVFQLALAEFKKMKEESRNLK